MKHIFLFIFSLLIIENLSAEILTVTNTNDSGTGSLRRLVEIANNGDSIIFDKSLAGKTIELQSAISIKNTISVSGKNASVILSGNNINGGKSIDGLTFINTNTSISSRLIFDCTFINSGVGVSGTVSISNCAFKNNTTFGDGGAIACNRTSSNYLTITNCTFENITTFGNGGVIDCFNTYTTTITNCLFKNNVGSVILNNPTYVIIGQTFTVTDCTFENNKGSVIYINSYGLITIGNCIFTANNSGSAIDCSALSLIITNCLFEGNSFEGNSTANRGGAISSGNLTIADCTFRNNTANYGGAIWSQGDSNLSTIVNCTFENNTATSNGGAINSDLRVINCTFNNNSAKNGGAIYGQSMGIINNCTFSNNSANNGGAIYGSSILKGNIFINNKIMPDNILNDVYNGMSNGYNVYTSNQNTVFSASTDYRYTGTQPLLVPLGNYGGNTASMPINTSVSNWETIVRRVPLDASRTTDQRGLPLPKTGFVCAGSVEMQPNEHYTGITDIQKESVNVYPNPTSDVIHFIVENSLEALIYDTLGKLVKRQLCKIGSNEIIINDLPKGIYFLNVNGKSTKIIKE